MIRSKLGNNISSIKYIKTNFASCYIFTFEISCWLTDKSYETTLFLIPVLVLCSINFIIFLIIFHLIRRLSRERNQGVTMAQVISLMALVTAFGLGWLFSVVALANKGEIRDAFGAVFVVFSQIQGTLIFILYCVAKKEVRVKYLELFGYVKITTTTSEFSGKHTTKTNIGMHSMAQTTTTKTDHSVSYNTYFEPNKENDEANLFQNGTPVVNINGNDNAHPDSVQF